MSFLAATGRRSGWEVTAMPDAIDFQEGPGILAKDFRESGVPLVRLSGLARGASVLDGCNYLDADMVDRRWSHFRLKAGDILLSTSASLGRVAVVTRVAEGAIAYTGIIRMRPRGPSVLAAYIPYLLESQEFLDQAEGMGAGSVIRHFGPTHLSRMKVTLPPSSIQERIVGILSAYDELIENCQRRIKILQAMARALYREWFAEFRFPDHENHARVASPLGEIPQGWEVRRLGEIAEVNRAQINARTAPEALHYIDISSVSPGQIDFMTTYTFVDAPGRARRIVQHGDVLWSCVRPNRRSHALVMNPTADTIASTGFAVITATKVPFTFLYAATTTDDFVGYLTNNASGAAYPAVTASTFERAHLLVPSGPLLKQFGDATIPMAEQISVLQRESQVLRRTRDLLLPRLLSGQVRLEAA
jgi:type I restriction enzyme S subunit